MKKIIYFLSALFSTGAFGQSAIITPNTGGNGNFLFKSTGANYGQFSTTSTGANLVFRVNEPTSSIGNVGLITGAIYSDATRTVLAGYTDSGQLYGINKVEIGTNAVSNRMVMLSNGCVGMGVTNPQSRLEAVITGPAVASWANYQRPLRMGISVTGSHAAVNDNYDAIGIAGFGANANYATNRRNIGVFGTTVADGYDNIAVYGYQSGAFNNAANPYGVRGEVEQSGNAAAYGVYAVTQGSGSGTKYGLYSLVSGSGTKYAGYFLGNVYIGGDFFYTGSFSATSDEKLKTNLKAMDSGLDKIMALNPSSYEYKTTEYQNMNLSKGSHYGFTAQGVQKVMPELVSEKTISNATPENKTDQSTTTYLSVNYIEIIPVLTKAIQEQQTMILQLQAEMKSIKNK
jgi:hypothetical protein